FHPTPHTEDWLGPPDPRVEDIALQSADGTPIHAWWLAPPGWEPAHGATLYSSGNAGNLSHRGDQIAERQSAVGGAILIFADPGCGRSEGSPSESGCYAAADAACDWLVERQKVPPERVVFLGRSLGGGVATHLASRRPHRALVLINTFTSVPDM